MASLGGRIKDCRVALNWTQEVLARNAGISKGFLSDIENDKRGISADKLIDIANVLGVNLDFLATGDGKEQAGQQKIEIPASLARFASEAKLSFRNTLMLLEMRRQIIAHRSSTKNEDDDNFNWNGFYASVKEYL